MDTVVVDPLVGRLLDGRYRLEQRIARGGMATVYTATDTRLDRVVAVKVMRPSLAEDVAFVERFGREARAAARLSSPFVVAVHDQGTDADGTAYLVMEHVDGHTLREVVATEGALPAARAMAVMEPVLRALAAAHGAGLVHRDIKPENVLLSADGRIKVADFGLARAIEASSATASTGVLIGTVAYLAPEQVEHGEADARSDVYAAGILLWELLTGAAPYHGPSPLAIAYRHVHEDLVAPGSVVAGVPAALDALVVAATRRDPAARPVDGAAFLSALHAARADLTGASVGRMGGAGRRAGSVRVAATDAGPGLDAQALHGRGPQPQGPDAQGPDAQGRDAKTTGRRPGTGSRRSPDGRVAAPQPTLVVPRSVRVPPANEPAATQTRGRRRLVLLLVGLLVLLAGGGAGALAALTTPAPNVVGATKDEALQELQAAGFHIEQLPSRFDAQMPAQRIISQQPGPGERVRRGGTVAITNSMGPPVRVVPTVVGLQQEAAAAQIVKRGLALGTVTQRYSDQPEGAVLGADPGAGQRLRPGSTVALTVSKGVELLPVPEVVGQEQARAERVLQTAGLTAEVSTAFDDAVAEGLVVSQEPAAGSAARGSTVALAISKGPDVVAVPNLNGKSRSQAAAALQAVGLVPKFQVVLAFGPESVLRSDPSRGKKVKRGSTVTVYLF